jgi:hypothetical protein
LPGLQAAIRAGKVPSFRSITALDAHGFYDEDKGTNYGQARYLCYYLQQRGLFIKFYRQFHTHQKQDPTGYKSLQKILGMVDMKAFQRKWEKYVMGLKQGFEVDSLPPSDRNRDSGTESLAIASGRFPGGPACDNGGISRHFLLAPWL